MDNSKVQIIYVLLDGVGDLPHPDLDGKTPLEAAKTPTLDKIASNGVIGEVISVGKGIAPESDIAVFNMLGYKFQHSDYAGRGVVEAIGIGIDVEEPMGNMIIDIGGGTSEIAVIALGGIVTDKNIRVAGDEFTSDIEEYMRRQHNILIGERTAEQIKIEVGAALDKLENPPEDYAVRGRDLMTGIPKEIHVSYKEIAHSLDKSISKIEEAILSALEMTPPELSADIYKTGIYLAGGGSMLRGLDKRLSKKTDLPVYIAEDPLRAVVRGTGIVLKNLPKYKSVLIK